MMLVYQLQDTAPLPFDKNTVHNSCWVVYNF